MEASLTSLGGSLGTLGTALAQQEEGLLNCVHCGFCLPACPTYRRLGDEADSPRGRLYLMQAVVEGRIDASSDAFQIHIDRCLGCRACEPVCPSGVEYGHMLELARQVGNEAKPPQRLTSLLLKVMGSSALRSWFFLGGRILRGTGLASLGASLMPRWGPLENAKLGLSMLAATKEWQPPKGSGSQVSGGGAAASAQADAPVPQGVDGAGTGRVGMLTGCVQDGLFGRVNDATARTLQANGYEVVPVQKQDCCGALHAHGGALDEARSLARRNIEAFEAASVDFVAVNAAGCGAAMKDYGNLFAADEIWLDRARAFAAKVRDVNELLASAGPRSGAPVDVSLAYDHPCHLAHAQGIRKEPLQVLAAVPGVDVRLLEGADECCGGAGIYGMTHPELGGRIGGDKVADVLAAGATAACTPNAGCMMQIGAGLRLQGSEMEVVHPVEVLDESYRRAGHYS